MIAAGIQAAGTRAYEYVDKNFGLRFDGSQVDVRRSEKAMSLDVRQYEDGTTVASGLSDSTKDKWLGFLADRAGYIRGAYSLVTHGNPDVLTMRGIEYDNPYEIAEVIKANGWKEGQPITIYGCEFAGGHGQTAWQLSQILGVPVAAAENSVYPGAMAMGIDFTKWRTFAPEPVGAVYDWRKYYK